MAKFKVLEYNQKFMSRFGIQSHNLNEPTNEFFKSPATYYVLINVILFTIISSAIFIYENVSQFELALQTSIIVIAGLQCGGMFLTFGLNIKKVKELHINLQNFVDEGDLKCIRSYKKSINRKNSMLENDSIYYS